MALVSRLLAPTGALYRITLPSIVAGLSCLYMGERVLQGTARVATTSVGAGCLLVALAVAIYRAFVSAPERREAARSLLLEYVLCAVALGMYVLALSDLVWHATGALRTFLRVLWPMLLALALGPLLISEWAVLGMARTTDLELWRVALARRGARIMVLALVGFGGLNYAASVWNFKADLSYFRAGEPGASTRALAAGLTQSVELYLFFPPGNDVAEMVHDYAQALVTESRFVNVTLLDQALAPELARQFRVRDNGVVVFRAQNRFEQLLIGTDLEQAREVLRALDARMQQHLLRVSRPPRLAYMTTGHLERDFAPPADDQRAGTGSLKKLLEGQGFEVRRFGMGEGLASQISDDVDLVVVAGPLRPFHQGEIDALVRYFKAGGALLIAIDPDRGDSLKGLLGQLGVGAGKGLIANDRVLVRLGRGQESPYHLVTSRTSLHPAMRTLQSQGNRLSVLMAGAGALEQTETLPANTKISWTLRTPPQSWIDVDADGQFNPQLEQRGVLPLMAAIEYDPTSASTVVRDSQGEGEKADGSKKETESNTTAMRAAGLTEQSRAVVLPDADALGDALLANGGNTYLLLDAVRWLVHDEAVTGQVHSELDVPIVHRKDQDALWFYGVAFGAPVLFVLAGLLWSLRYTRREQRL